MSKRHLGVVAGRRPNGGAHLEFRSEHYSLLVLLTSGQAKALGVLLHHRLEGAVTMNESGSIVIHVSGAKLGWGRYDSDSDAVAWFDVDNAAGLVEIFEGGRP